MRFTLGLRMRITVALAVTAAATALFAVLGAMWIIAGIIDRADQRELRSHYDALLSRISEESHRAAAMSAVSSGNRESRRGSGWPSPFAPAAAVNGALAAGSRTRRTSGTTTPSWSARERSPTTQVAPVAECK